MNSLRFVRSFHAARILQQVKTINNAAEFKTALKSEKPVFIDFFATWCGPCKMVAPFIESMSNQVSSVDFYKLDVDELKVGDVVSALRITAMPTFIAFKNGEEFNRIVGADPRKIKNLVDELN